jgi:hypothetical protein
MRSHSELLSDDPAWPGIAAAAHACGRASVLPREDAAARSCLERLQVTTRSPLGALAYETGGLLIDSGWLRLFGCGHPKLQRALGAWNEFLAIPLSEFLLIADDVVGGAFAINGGALGAALGNVFYFSPDILAWEDTKLGHTAFVHWAFEGDLATYYENMRWPGWQAEIAQVGGEHVLSLWPPPWTREGKDISKVSRRPVPALEQWRLQQEIAEQLGPPSLG